MDKSTKQLVKEMPTRYRFYTHDNNQQPKLYVVQDTWNIDNNFYVMADGSHRGECRLRTDRDMIVANFIQCQCPW